MVGNVCTESQSYLEPLNPECWSEDPDQYFSTIPIEISTKCRLPLLMMNNTLSQSGKQKFFERDRAILKILNILSELSNDYLVEDVALD